ncbi:MAG: gliding motility-associated C-terminal domain-containing protein, partial [Phaeodactylibacter sp.]|nr:gliding motility-associated C-terminal domain-containing protein [Phaeodactylibacter sp.]
IPDTAYVKAVPDSLSVAVDGPDKVCEGDSICLTATVGPDPIMAMVTWTDETGAVLGTGLELCVAPGPGMHTYTATADNGCAVASDSKTVKVLSDTTKIEITPSDTTLCELSEVCFEVTDTALWDCIQWVDASGNIVGTGGELCVTPPGFGLYWYVAQVDSTLRCVLPDTAYVKAVPDSLSVAVEGPDKVCEGDSICLTATVGPDPAMAMVTWTDETGAVLGTGLELCVAPGPGMHTYTATADNGCAVASGSKTVKVLSDTTKIEITPADTVTLCAPEEVCFEVTDTTLWDCIQWVDASGAIVGTGGSLCVMPTEPGLYQYIARVDSTLSCVTPDTAYINLAPQDIAITVSPDTSKLCVGDVAELTATVFPDTSMATITWYDEDNNIVGDGNSLVFVASEAGAFKYTAVADNGCATAMDMAWVYVFAENTKLEIDPDSLVVCTPDTVCLTVLDVATPECVVWTTLDGVVVGTGDKLCVIPEPGDNVFIADIPGVDCIEADTAVIRFVISDVAVEVEPSDTIVCRGDSVKLSAIVTPDDGMANVSWYDEDYMPLNETGMMITVSPDTAGVFTFIAIADNGCAADTAMASITVVDSTKLEIIPADTILCGPDTLKLSVGNAGSDYVVWYNENGDSIGMGMMITVVPDYGIHTYSVQIPEADCVEGDTVMVKVLPDSLNLSVLPTDTLVCAGEQVSFIAELDPDWTMAQVTWYDDVFEEVGTGDTLVVAVLAGPNVYFAIADNGCARDTAQAMAEGLELNVSISASPDSLCANRDEQSQLLVTGCDDCTYAWDNAGTLSDPNIPNPVATPNVTTTYSVTVTDGVCVETLSITVTVEDCPEECPIEEFFVATAFTPNGDNVNDVACLRSEHFDKFSEIEFMIYNRWGEEMFRETYKVDPSAPEKFPDADFFCWDGTYRGKVLPPDVYGYYLRLVCPETADRAEEEKVVKGNITLLQR